MSGEWLRLRLEHNLEIVLRKIFFWEKDDKRLGILIRFLHHSFVYLCLIWYILLHTFMTSYVVFLLFFVIIGIIWIQHCIVGGCVFTRIETRLIGDTRSFVDPILETFHIPITPESTDGFVLLGSTTIMFVLSCEFTLRTITGIRNWFSI